MDIKHIIALFCCTLFLYGCASQLPKNVYIPIVSKSTPLTMPQRPDLPIGKLNEKSTPDDVIKSYVASIKLLQGYAIQLEELLAAEDRNV